jgi:predicted HicB family RNase H-like nuclease
VTNTMNIMSIDNYRAAVTYDSDANMLRGEFLGLNGGADFYASDMPTLKAEGAKSLAAFLKVCKENGIDPELRAANLPHTSTGDRA